MLTCGTRVLTPGFRTITGRPCARIVDLRWFPCYGNDFWGCFEVFDAMKRLNIHGLGMLTAQKWIIASLANYLCFPACSIQKEVKQRQTEANPEPPQKASKRDQPPKTNPNMPEENAKNPSKKVAAREPEASIDRNLSQVYGTPNLRTSPSPGLLSTVDDFVRKSLSEKKKE